MAYLSISLSLFPIISLPPRKAESVCVCVRIKSARAREKRVKRKQVQKTPLSSFFRRSLSLSLVRSLRLRLLLLDAFYLAF